MLEGWNSPLMKAGISKATDAAINSTLYNLSLGSLPEVPQITEHLALIKHL